MPSFNRENIQSFHFVGSDFDASTGWITLIYSFDQDEELVERIQIPGAPFILSLQRADAIQRAIRLLHLFAGVSYYKAACPPRLIVHAGGVDPMVVDLVQAVYQQGLAEFAYINQRTLTLDFSWSDIRRGQRLAPSVGLNSQALVAIGGGKDSLVSIETLREVKVSQTVTWIGQAPLIQACAMKTGLPTLQIRRELAAQLGDYNRQGAWNGHVPVTAINSAILVIAALLHDCDQVVFSNERSASVGSTIPMLGLVNHQWSKSWAFEQPFGQYVRQHIAADLSYYSLLRPYSEIAVARQFARQDRYDRCFSSCNRNFHLHGHTPEQRWCGQCPKCHFVFLALAPFMNKQRLMTIFGGRNLLNESQWAGAYDSLIEFQSPKPFECVGEAQESRAALQHLAQDPLWQADALVSRFGRHILPHLETETLSLSALLQSSGEHQIPQAIWPDVDAIFTA